MAFVNWLWSAIVDRLDLAFGAAGAYGAPAMTGARFAVSLRRRVARARGSQG